MAEQPRRASRASSRSARGPRASVATVGEHAAASGAWRLVGGWGARVLAFGRVRPAASPRGVEFRWGRTGGGEEGGKERLAVSTALLQLSLILTVVEV
jgi:hypothetical protein